MKDKIAIIIPCRNEKQFIEECIVAIIKSSRGYAFDFHIFAVDGMSNDGTREILKELSQIYQNLTIIDNSEQLTPIAFNLGIKFNYFDFDYFQIIGARHIISENYLNECLETLKLNKEIWCIGGRLINAYSNFESELISKVMATKFGMGLDNFRTLNKSRFTDTVTSPMYPKRVFELIGFFDEELVRNQDDDFNYRILKAGGKIFFNADISLKYYVRTSFEGLKKQFFQYGYWKVYVNRKHQAITTFRQVIPALFVCFMLFIPLTLFYFPLFKLSIILLTCYFTISIYTSFTLSKSVKGFFYSVYTFLLLHISYGMGYLSGIWDFLILNKSPSDKNKSLSR